MIQVSEKEILRRFYSIQRHNMRRIARERHHAAGWIER